MDIEQQEALVEGSGYFDAQWYQAQYPDVARLSMSPLHHYLRYGWRVGRHPSPRFDTKKYLQHYRDVARAGLNPLVHFLRNGQQEGRSAWPVSGQHRQAGSGGAQAPAAASATAARLPSSVLDTPNEVPKDEAHRLGLQLKQTQQLLEHYFSRCQELEYQLMDR